jgi:hypothetical protein
VWEAIWADLHMELREELGREASSSAAIIDSQSLTQKCTNARVA